MASSRRDGRPYQLHRLDGGKTSHFPNFKFLTCDSPHLPEKSSPGTSHQLTLHSDHSFSLRRTADLLSAVQENSKKNSDLHFLSHINKHTKAPALGIPRWVQRGQRGLFRLRNEKFYPTPRPTQTASCALCPRRCAAKGRLKRSPRCIDVNSHSFIHSFIHETEYLHLQRAHTFFEDWSFVYLTKFSSIFVPQFPHFYNVLGKVARELWLGVLLRSLELWDPVVFGVSRTSDSFPYYSIWVLVMENCKGLAPWVLLPLWLQVGCGSVQL